MEQDYGKSFNDLVHRTLTNFDVEQILQELYRELHLLFPLDMFNMPIHHFDRETLEYLVLVTDERVMFVDETIKLSKSDTEWVNQALGKKLFCWNNSRQSDLFVNIGAQVGLNEVVSTMGLTMQIQPSRHLALGLVARGCDQYAEEHLRIMEELYEPLTILLRHVLKQLEFSHLKERLLTENRELKKRLDFLSSNRIVGAKTGLKQVMVQVQQVAALHCPVLIMGETGVGKEVIANIIHQYSSRVKGPMISFNCGAIPETLIESELFGHEKGAFTGAITMKRGYFEQADGGTVFLDEIGELSLQAQVKLIRILQTMEFQRVGGSKNISIDIRVIAATNRDMHQMVKDKQFRKDLWYRLNVFPIHIPPLRRRKEDISNLAQYFASRKAIEMGLPFKPRFSPGAIEQLQQYEWPGNVRELRNVIERSLILSQGEPLSFSHIFDKAHDHAENEPTGKDGNFLTMDEMTALHIRKGLERCNGRVGGKGGAAELLAINPSTLRARMRKLGVK